MLVEKADVLGRLNLLVLSGMDLAFVEQVKNLGLLMDPTLLFEKKVDIVIRNVFYHLIWLTNSFMVLANMAMPIQAFETSW